MSGLMRLRWGRVPVPISACWEGEADAEPTMERWGHGSQPGWYAVTERDRPGSGRPLFTKLHGPRCRRLLALDACQMCGERLGFRRVVVSYAGFRLRGLPLVSDGLPMHPACMRLAADACPGLQRHEAAGTLMVLEVGREDCEMVPKLLGIAHGPGANHRLNRLLRTYADRHIFNGPDLLVHRHRLVALGDLPAAPAGLLDRMQDAMPGPDTHLASGRPHTPLEPNP